MSRKRPKHFPPGTFIPFPQRLLAIIQLCLAFSVILWYGAQPFMGEYFSLRSRMLLYEYVMGTSDIVKNQLHQEEKLHRQAQRFEVLPTAKQQKISLDYKILQTHANRPLFQKISDGLRVLFLEIPPFELAWLGFSITIAILILLKIEGAKQASWILPLITLFYTLDNQWTGHPPSYSPDYDLFPTESFLIQNQYAQSTLGQPLVEQKQQLEKGWESYLVTNWLPASLNIEQSWAQKVEEAEYNFTIARLDRLHGQSLASWLFIFRDQVNPSRLIIYLIWNFFFAWTMNRHKYSLLAAKFV